MKRSEIEKGQQLRYRPGYGTYGYEDMVEKDGRLPAEVIGFSPTRIRVVLTSARTMRTVTRCVDAESLVLP